MGSKARCWPCGCMSEGLMYCGQNVTALSNKTENFWMWNLAAVVSPQTCRKVCARVCRNSEGTQGIRNRKMLNQHCLSSSSRGLFQDLLRMSWLWNNKKKTTQRIVEVWGERRSYVNVAVDSGVSSGPSGLPPGEHECGILVLIPLLENLGQTLLFTGSHFPYWSNKKLNWITLEIFFQFEYSITILSIDVWLLYNSSSLR